MDDTLYGKRDKRGNWTPNKKLQRSPIFVWPAQPLKFLRWFLGYPGYLWPWNAGYFAVSLIVWLYLTPSLETMREFHAQWISLILARNAALTVALYGGFHLIFYVMRRQQTEFKYNAKWPDIDNPTFLFGNQNAENIFWTMCSAVPIWTAVEAATWWLYANGYLPYVAFAKHPVYFVALLILVPAWRELHFYLIHRLIHVGPLYHWVHKLHHNNINPGPWSGLSMHPVEHFLYFTGVVIHFVVPSHPLHSMFQLMHAGLSPAKSHVGFDKMVVDGDHMIDTDNYYHYLHHKYFEVNYGEKRIPLDEWFGTFHDGSPESDEVMARRIKAKKYTRGGSA
ncbi:desaturase [Mesorhizobium sp. LNHC252B00]|uniref:sterol desaturase family protein n=1 Tax=Mesorhizobium sp. LNHC252B00 TaxID=1287252 RepID=UPI0003CF3636|nr:sterol desaturase family protein [Mesorhizobium sp. LNHC252B00]ESY63561.1 desaturase [Mesorhizobium sp. LNHC252B00]